MKEEEKKSNKALIERNDNYEIVTQPTTHHNLKLKETKTPTQ